MEFTFIPVTAENRRQALGLHIAPAQKGTVETVEECLKEAAALSLWRPVLIQAEGENVGFAMFGLWMYEGARGRVWLDRFFIDSRYQGRGLAKGCLPPLIQHIQKSYGYNRLYLSVYKTNLPAITLYQKLGFCFNGETDLNGERVMVLEL